MKTRHALIASLAIAFTGAAFAVAPPPPGAGPLTPPSGADPTIGPINALTPGGLPQPTMKTLHQVEPRTPLNAGSPGVTQNANGGFTITQAGSYYLTANIAVTTGDGIIVEGSPATLDLNGFHVASTASPADGMGIKIGNGGSRNLRITNGAILGATTNTGSPNPLFTPAGFSKGIGWSASSPDLIQIDHLIIEGIGGSGIDVALANVSDCRVFNCGNDNLSHCIIANEVRNSEARVCSGIGIKAGSVVGCSAVGCGLFGIEITSSASETGIVRDCSVSRCERGIIADYSNITNCSVSGNSGFGMQANHSTVSNCIVSENDGDGIKGGLVISGCTVTGNTGAGIVSIAGTVKDCTAMGNGSDGSVSGTHGAGAGISAPNGLVQGCNATGNYQNGIYAPGGFVTACRAGGNSLTTNGSWSNIFVGAEPPPADPSYPAGQATNNF